jgi:hypothetical protein
MVLQSSFHFPFCQLWCHNLHSTFHSVNYGTTIFIRLSTSSVMVPQSLSHLPVFQLRYHNLHSTSHSVSFVAIIFCPCTSLSFVMQHSSFLVKERRVVGIIVIVRKREDGNVNFTMTREYFYLQAAYIAIPKYLSNPPCCVTNRKFFELLIMDFSARSGWASTWHRTERLTVPSHVPPEDRISRISSSQPPTIRIGSSENLPLKIGIN